jgi:hypothetical protein
MTKLEEQIARAMESADRESSKRFTSEDYAKAAAEVAKRYIEKAWQDSFLRPDVTYDQWCKENGL